MNGPESQFYQKTSGALRMFDWISIENAIASGTFDTVVNFPGLGSAWVEFKIGHHKNPIDDLEGSQVAWAYKRLRKGVTNLGLLRSEKDDPVLYQIRLKSNRKTLEALPYPKKQDLADSLQFLIVG